MNPFNPAGLDYNDIIAAVYRICLRKKVLIDLEGIHLIKWTLLDELCSTYPERDTYSIASAITEHLGIVYHDEDLSEYEIRKHLTLEEILEYGEYGFIVDC